MKTCSNKMDCQNLPMYSEFSLLSILKKILQITASKTKLNSTIM